MLATGLIVAYGYVMEAFFGYYSANKYEGFMVRHARILCRRDDDQWDLRGDWG